MSSAIGMYNLDSERELFTFFRNNPPPACSGSTYTYELPAGLELPLFGRRSHEKMIVRGCYERVKSIVDRRVDDTEQNGVIFTGGPGLGKSWCSVFIMWNLLYEKRTVVYHSCDYRVTYVVRSDGKMYMVDGSANAAKVPELRKRETIHIFDSMPRVDYQPVSAKAFVLVFSCRDPRNYTSTSRLPNVQKCCIPSYDVEELEKISDVFGSLSVDAVRQRCLEIGPTVRFVLQNRCDEHKRFKTFMEKLAKRVTPDELNGYIADVPRRSSEVYRDFTALLLAATVDESQFEDPDEAYLDKNVKWVFASESCARIHAEKWGLN